MYYEKAADEKSYYLFRYGLYDESTETYVTPPHCHDGYELLIVTKGSAETVVNGERKKLFAGEIFFADSYDIHSFIFDKCERYSLVFSKDYCKMFAMCKFGAVLMIASDILEHSDCDRLMHMSGSTRTEVLENICFEIINDCSFTCVTLVEE